MFDFSTAPIPQNRTVLLNLTDGEVVRFDVWPY